MSLELLEIISATTLRDGVPEDDVRTKKSWDERQIPDDTENLDPAVPETIQTSQFHETINILHV